MLLSVFQEKGMGLFLIITESFASCEKIFFITSNQPHASNQSIRE